MPVTARAPKRKASKSDGTKSTGGLSTGQKLGLAVGLILMGMGALNVSMLMSTARHAGPESDSYGKTYQMLAERNRRAKEVAERLADKEAEAKQLSAQLRGSLESAAAVASVKSGAGQPVAAGAPESSPAEESAKSGDAPASSASGEETLFMTAVHSCIGYAANKVDVGAFHDFEQKVANKEVPSRVSGDGLKDLTRTYKTMGYGVSDSALSAMFHKIDKEVDALNVEGKSVSVLFADPFWGSRQSEQDFGECPIHCHYSGDRKKNTQVDGIVHHLPNFQGYTQVNHETRQKQRWIAYQIECDNNHRLIRDHSTLSKFDGTMSANCDGHGPDSKLPHILTPLWSDYFFDDPVYWIPSPAMMYPSFHERKRAGVWMQNACDSPTGRSQYVAALQKFFPVHCYGPCMRTHTDSRAMSNPGPIIQQYLFYIALEPYELELSDKLPRAMQAGAIPVFRGNPRAKVSLPHPDAIIDVDDFASPEHLAAYLHEVANNEALWLYHTSWRNVPGQISQRFAANMRFQYIHSQCRACMFVATGQDPLSEEKWGQTLDDKNPRTDYAALTEGGGLEQRPKGIDRWNKQIDAVDRLYQRFPADKDKTTRPALIFDDHAHSPLSAFHGKHTDAVASACSWSENSNGGGGSYSNGEKWPVRDLNVAKARCAQLGEACKSVSVTAVGYREFYRPLTSANGKHVKGKCDMDVVKRLSSIVKSDGTAASNAGNSRASCQWVKKENSFLAEYAPDEQDALFSSALDARRACLRMTDCGGVTQESSTRFTTRRGEVAMLSTAGETSWVIQPAGCKPDPEKVEKSG